MSTLPNAARHATLVLFRDGSIARSRGFDLDLAGHDIREIALPSGVRTQLMDRLVALGDDVIEISDPEASPRLALTVLAIDALPIRTSVVSVRELLLRTMDVFAAQARSASVELAVECAPDVPPTLHGDSEKLAWLLATLVGNAVRLVRGAAAVEPRVVVRAGYAPEVGARGALTFAVTDNGPGMPEQVARWLFDRDPTTGRPAGLALAMARDVVHAHGGTIAVESRLGAGATFRVILPRETGSTR